MNAFSLPVNSKYSIIWPLLHSIVFTEPMLPLTIYFFNCNSKKKSYVWHLWLSYFKCSFWFFQCCLSLLFFRSLILPIPSLKNKYMHQHVINGKNLFLLWNYRRWLCVFCHSTEKLLILVMWLELTTEFVFRKLNLNISTLLFSWSSTLCVLCTIPRA